jgi:hypothetical protein
MASSRVGARTRTRIGRPGLFAAVGLAVGGTGRREALQDGQGEGRGLAGAGLGAAQQVAAAQDVRNGLLLDRGRLGVAFLGHRPQEPAVEAEGDEALAGGGRWGLDAAAVEAGDVDGRGPFGLLDEIERDAGPFGQGGSEIGRQAAAVQEDIFAPLVGDDKAKAFARVIPFNRAGLA